ncbi:hypothetical protein E1B28_013686 [Marasmius oreades]|uniref:F-box domain-containing protein n=1 Tax=Marasmius oreades TaxID=181124 RepID=A0A9P7RR32_9AGAR|nr:uncharacterized protein E1B28_013686 [Marasmius oreades]KAG7087745.1 hypothetical protein E1B28_013686 [Marasmius oreades]
MYSPLERVPPDVLQNIAFLLESSDILSPQRDLLSLLLTCSAMYNSLSPVAAPHLYARLFRSKFDTGALLRRLPLQAGILTDSSLTNELMIRCRLLARLRSRLTQSSLLEENVLEWEDLRAALRMTLESEGLNEAHLASAGFGAYMVEYLMRLLETRGGLRHSNRHIQGEEVSLALWLLILNWSQADVCILSEDMRRKLIVLLRPLVHSSINVESERDVVKLFTTEAKQYFRGDPHMGCNSTTRTTDLADLYSCPPAASAAILLTCVLKEIDKLQAPPHLPVTRTEALSSGRSGPTMEDYRTISSYTTLLFGDDRPVWNGRPSNLNRRRSLRHDPSFFHQKLELIPDRGSLTGSAADDDVVPALRQLPLVRSNASDVYSYISEFLDGVWAGYYMVSPSLNRDLDTPVSKASNDLEIPDFLCRRPMQAAFSLFFSFQDCGDISLEDIWRVLLDYPASGGSCDFSLDSDLSLEISGRHVSYKRLSSGSKGARQLDQSSLSLATDCVLVGQVGLEMPGVDVLDTDLELMKQTLPEHEQAWSAYRFIGRVRKDGLITFRRVSKYSSDVLEGLGAWTFRGHLRYGAALVGTWNSSPSGSGGIGGVFGMGKNLSPSDQCPSSSGQ